MRPAILLAPFVLYHIYTAIGLTLSTNSIFYIASNYLHNRACVAKNAVFATHAEAARR